MKSSGLHARQVSSLPSVLSIAPAQSSLLFYYVLVCFRVKFFQCSKHLEYNTFVKWVMDIYFLPVCEVSFYFLFQWRIFLVSCSPVCLFMLPLLGQWHWIISDDSRTNVIKWSNSAFLSIIHGFTPDIKIISLYGLTFVCWNVLNSDNLVFKYLT